MKKILFVCYGNICRSPMAEAIMLHLLKERKVEERYYLESAATSSEELGNDIYYLAKKKLAEKGISFAPRRARQLRADDYEKFDYIIGMEMANIHDIKNIIGLDYSNKVVRLLDYTEEARDIADPWGTGLFEEAYNDIHKGCQAFLEYLLNDCRD